MRSALIRVFQKIPGWPTAFFLLLVFSPGIPDLVRKSESKTPGADLPNHRNVMASVPGGFSAISEPYPSLGGGSFSAPAVPESPDPLVSYRWAATAAADDLQVYFLRPAKVEADVPGAFENLASLTSDSPDVTVNKPGTIRVDFGVESAAWLEIESDDLAGRVEMGISEYNQPAVVNIGPENPVKRKTPVRYGNVYRLELNREFYEGVRFGWIHVVSVERPWHIRGIRAVCQVKPTNYEGSFRCSDPVLTRIWYTGAYTVKLNLLRDYFGAILMDRGDRYSWTGDAHPAQAAAMAAFGNFDFVKANIERTAADGNWIESYSLYWVLSLVDYYMFTGDGTTFGKHLAAAEGKLAQAAAIYESRQADLYFYGWDERLGAGFEDPNTEESWRAYRMLFIRACREFGRAMEFFGRAETAAEYAALAAAKIDSLRTDPQWFKPFGLHAAADAVNAGFTDLKEKTALFSQVFFNSRERISYSPFNQYFVIRALGAIGRPDIALETVKEYWGGQLDYGGTTFFEVFRPDWNNELKPNDPVPNNQCGYTSLAHPWGAGVTRWLTDEILGVKPTKPGFETFEVTPRLGRRLTAVSGIVPTVHGPIEAAFDLQTGRCRLVVPNGTSGRFGIPKEGRPVKWVSVNGKRLYDGDFHQVGGVSRAAQDDGYLYLDAVSPGAYDIFVFYGGSAGQWPIAIHPFEAGFLGTDVSTQGNWKGTYGNAGYVLFNFDGDGADATVLPAYLRAVTLKKNGSAFWIRNTDDVRALQSPGENSDRRNAAYIHTLDPLATYQTMTVDIETNASLSSTFRVALYFVDWDDGKRTSAVEMFDLKSKKLISPLKIVSDFKGGKYLIFSYHRACRFRINQVRGENAVLSGIFFDND